MQVFEFQFNPKKKNKIVNTYCYDSEKTKNGKTGYLYMTGEIINPLPGSEQFLDNLAKTIKEEYYSEFYHSFDESIRKSLARANDYLSSQISRNNVSWLGNLNFAIISFCNKNGLNISKIGNVKILMIKNEKIINIAKNTNSSNLVPQESFYSPKTFGKLISGKINRGDKIVLLTKEIFDSFQELLILESMSEIYCLTKGKLEYLINSHKNDLIKNSGAMLLIETSEEKTEIDTSDQKQDFVFSFKEMFGSFWRKFLFFFLKKIKKTKKNKKRKPRLGFLEKINFKKINFSLSQDFLKTILLIIFLITLLLVGSFYFNST